MLLRRVRTTRTREILISLYLLIIARCNVRRLSPMKICLQVPQQVRDQSVSMIFLDRLGYWIVVWILENFFLALAIAEIRRFVSMILWILELQQERSVRSKHRAKCFGPTKAILALFAESDLILMEHSSTSVDMSKLFLRKRGTSSILAGILPLVLGVPIRWGKPVPLY